MAQHLDQFQESTIQQPSLTRVATGGTGPLFCEAMAEEEAMKRCNEQSNVNTSGETLLFSLFLCHVEGVRDAWLLRQAVSSTAAGYQAD